VPGVLGVPGAPPGRRPECRDHDLAGDRGGPRGRARARSAVIKNQFMITEPDAGDAAGSPRAGRAAGRWRCRVTASAGRYGGSPGVAYDDNG